jgi:hypothetical protein
MAKHPLNVGARVRYSSAFCRTIGAATGWTPQARGVITRLWGAGFAEVLWDFPCHPDGNRLGGAHTSALEPERPHG